MPTTNRTTADVQIQRKDLIDVMPRYQRISDTLAGEHAVKAAKSKYLTSSFSL